MWPANRKLITFEESKNGCFLCTSHKGSHPKLSRNGEVALVARFVYEECFGFIPNGMVLRHKCHNGRCVNPEHLTYGTYKDNYEDSKLSGRHAHGKNHGRAKLTTEQAKVIKYSNDTAPILAEKYGIDKSVIRRIKRSELWAHV